MTRVSAKEKYRYWKRGNGGGGGRERREPNLVLTKHTVAPCWSPEAGQTLGHVYQKKKKIRSLPSFWKVRARCNAKLLPPGKRRFRKRRQRGELERGAADPRTKRLTLNSVHPRRTNVPLQPYSSTSDNPNCPALSSWNRFARCWFQQNKWH